MRSPCNVDHAVRQQEAGSLVRPQRIEGDVGAPVGCAGDGGAHDVGVVAWIARIAPGKGGVSDHDGATKLLGPRREVEGVEPLHVVGAAP